MSIARAITLSLCVALSLAQAQDEPRRGPEGGPRREGFGRGPRGFLFGFMLLDSDRDGTLTPAELDAAPTVLAKMDKDADGKVTTDEMRAWMMENRPRGGPGGPGGPRGEGFRRGAEGGREGGRGGASVVDDTVKTLMGFDANGDGKLAKSELPERMQGMMDKADENKDGFLSQDELRKFAAAQAAPPPSAGPRREGREGMREGGPEGGPRPGFREMNFIRIDPLLAAIDSDKDGVLSAAEIKAAPAALRKLDKDGDGQLTRQEFMPAQGEQPQRF